MGGSLGRCGSRSPQWPLRFMIGSGAELFCRSQLEVNFFLAINNEAY